jgi:phosphoribosylanthranilate isomerase
MTRVKICCMTSIEEMRLAVNFGASAVGLVSAMPSGPGVITEERIIEIAASVPPGISSFLLTSLQNVHEIIAQQRRCGTNTIQICDRLPAGSHAVLKKSLPGIKIVQVIHVTGEESVDEAAAAAGDVDAILLDSGNQNLPVRELGGTGRTHDWSISRKIRDSIGIPLFLAGGLNPDNVSDAIKAVRPFGVDVCSGVRSDGKLHKEKLVSFMKNVSALA